MKNRFDFLRTGVLIVLVTAGIFSARCLYAQSQVSRYTAATFSGTWTDASGGTFIGDNDDANYSFPGPPFAFNFDSVNYSASTTMYVETNGYTGWSALADDGNTEYNDGVGEFTHHANTIDPFSCDLVAGGQVYSNGTSGGIYYQTIGSQPNRVFIIEWLNFETYNNGNYTSMEVKLYEGSNVIECVYKDHSFYLAAPADGNGGGTGLNGLASRSPNDYIRYGSSAQSSTPSSDVQFTPPNALPAAEMFLTPKSLNFGQATPNSPDTMFATVKSVGVAGTTIHITGASIQGSSAYSIVSGPANGTALPQGSSATYAIQFLPFTSGTLTATFGVSTDARDSNNQSVALTGVGAVPGVSYSTSVLFRGTATELKSSSPPQYIYVTSNGVGPLNFKSYSFYGLDAKDYTITHFPQNPLASGLTDSIGIVFSPTFEGVPDAHLVVTTTAANIPIDTILMFGVGILPHLTIAPVTLASLVSNLNHTMVLNFDSVQLGTDSCMQVQLSNPGSDTVAITQNYLSGKDFDFTLTPFTGAGDTLIPPGGSQVVQVCFAPLQRGYRTATLTLRTDIPTTEANPAQDTSSFMVQFIGTGVPSGQLSLTGPTKTDTINENTKNYSGCVTDTVWNTGAASLTLTALTLSGANAADFSESGLTLPVVIPAGGHLTFEVCSSPANEGPETATLTGTATSGSSTQTATLTMNVYGTLIGSQTQPGTPFSALTCLGDTDLGTIVITNIGNVPDTYTGSISGANASDFVIVTPMPSPVILPDSTFTFTVRYVPSTPGTENATFIMTRSSDGTSDGGSSLSGAAGAAIIAGNDTVRSTVTSSPVSFSVTVQNTGTCDWTPGDVSVQTPFTYVSGGGTSIAAGASGTLNFTIDASQPGTFSSPVTFTNSSGVSVPAANVNIYAIVAADNVALRTSQDGFLLGPSYPNPNTGSSDISVTLPYDAKVNVTLVDATGALVRTAFTGMLSQGVQTVHLDAKNLPSGTYFYTLTSGDVRLAREMILIK